LISGLALRYASMAAAALLTVFFGLMVVGYARGLAIDCGCFGPGDALGPKTLLRDGALLSLAILLAFLSMRPSEIRPTPKAAHEITMSA